MLFRSASANVGLRMAEVNAVAAKTLTQNARLVFPVNLDCIQISDTVDAKRTSSGVLSYESAVCIVDAIIVPASRWLYAAAEPEL